MHLKLKMLSFTGSEFKLLLFFEKKTKNWRHLTVNKLLVEHPSDPIYAVEMTYVYCCSQKIKSKPKVFGIKIQVTIILSKLHHNLSSPRMTHPQSSEMCHESSMLGLKYDSSRAAMNSRRVDSPANWTKDRLALHLQYSPPWQGDPWNKVP